MHPRRSVICDLVIHKSMEPTDFVVRRRGDDGREVVCGCGHKASRSIVPHLRKTHPETWGRWAHEFASLRNQGWSYRRIMRKFNDRDGDLLFSWTVIEREVNKLRERGDVSVIIPRKKRISEWNPSDFGLERTTLWKFPRRGSWAVHNNDYRGNWPPQVPRNLIQKYTSQGDLVIDPFSGGGTTLIEAWLMNRPSLGIDINPTAVEISLQRIQEMWDQSRDTLDIDLNAAFRPKAIRGDARNLVEVVKDTGCGKGKLLCVHPPYLDSLRYTESISGDVSRIHDPPVFLKEIRKIAEQILNVMDIGGHAAIQMGDVRRKGKIYPLGFEVLNEFAEAGFILEEIIVKEQFRDESTEFWHGKDAIRYLLAHEYLFVFSGSNRVGLKERDDG